MSNHRSHSQVTQFGDCGYKYFLNRRIKVSGRPSWALIGGRTIHRLIEEFERKAKYAETSKPDAWPTSSWAKSRFTSLLFEEIEKEKDAAPPEFRAIADWSAANKGEEDFAWWHKNGQDMARFYADMNPANRGFSTVLLEPGKLAIEVELEVTWGKVRDKIVVDHMTIDKYNVVDIIDYKSGKRPPQDHGLQVITTAHAVQKLFPHLDVRGGFYYDLRQGKLSRLYETKEISEEAIIYLYETMDAAENSGYYLPRVSSFCSSCYVRAACVFGGEATSLVKEQ